MNVKKLVSKVSVVTIIGATVLSQSSMLYAKGYKRPSHNKVQYVKPGCGSNGTLRPGHIIVVKPGCGTGTTTKPENGSGSTTKPENNAGTTTKPDNNAGTTTKPEDTTQTSFENQVLELVNKERAKYGLNRLEMDESLRSAARMKSSDMSDNNYFSHTSPTYGSPFEMLKSLGIKYTRAAENIAQGYTTPQAVVKGWMNSSGHRANILNANYTHIGIGYDADGNYWTQLFITK